MHGVEPLFSGVSVTLDGDSLGSLFFGLEYLLLIVFDGEGSKQAESNHRLASPICREGLASLAEQKVPKLL